MKYPISTYIEYKIFCKTIVLETKTKLDNFSTTQILVKILLLIATIIGQSLLAYAAIATLLSLGLLAYFGSMGALIAANPWLAAIVITVSGASISSSIYMLYQEKETIAITKEVVVDRYEKDFKLLKQKLAENFNDLPPEHITAIENLMMRALIDLINALHKAKKLDESAFQKIIKNW